LVGHAVDAGKPRRPPQAYEQWEPTAATYASRTMMMSGIIVAVLHHLPPAALHGHGQRRSIDGQGFRRETGIRSTPENGTTFTK
jgi:hypothetical protein